MKLKCIWITLLFFSTVMSGQDQGKSLEGVNQVVFLGNSITYKGLYITYIETYLALQHPGREIEFINLGLPSETVSGLSEPGHAKGAFPRPDLHERLDRVLGQTSPDVIFACYGMNDGIYMPFDDARFQKYRAGIEWLHSEATASGIDIIFLTPPVFDPYREEAYSNVLDIYAGWLISKRYTDAWEVADLHWPMRKYLEDRREKDPSYYLAKDGIHPGETGHWLMAREVLLYLGYQELKDAESIGEALEAFQNGRAVLELVEQRQHIMKDAWLTSTGHTRPGMKEGVPLEDAKKTYEEIQQKIDRLRKSETTPVVK
jgi:lysophospholipase L1-like esterase